MNSGDEMVTSDGAINDAASEIEELNDLEVSLVGGGTGDISLG